MPTSLKTFLIGLSHSEAAALAEWFDEEPNTDVQIVDVLLTVLGSPPAK